MPRENVGYFTGADVEITLLNHPDERWAGEVVDCAFFNLTLGSSPIHIWNYARREGPAMLSPDQRGRLSQIEQGQASGAPFDDTARSNSFYKLQLILNQDRFKNTYYQFRSMSEIGDVKIKYSKQVEFGEDGLREAGYKLINGHVGTVSEEVNVRGSSHPAIQLTFEDAYSLGEARVIETSFAPGQIPDRVGVDRERLAQGLGRTPDQPAFPMHWYSGRIDGRVVSPQLFEALGKELPTTIDGYDSLTRHDSPMVMGDPQRWIPAQPFKGPIVVGGEDEYVYIWTQLSDEESDWGYRPFLRESETTEYPDNGMQKLQQYLRQME